MALPSIGRVDACRKTETRWDCVILTGDEQTGECIRCNVSCPRCILGKMGLRREARHVPPGMGEHSSASTEVPTSNLSIHRLAPIPKSSNRARFTSTASRLAARQRSHAPRYYTHGVCAHCQIRRGRTPPATSVCSSVCAVAGVWPHTSRIVRFARAALRQ